MEMTQKQTTDAALIESMLEDAGIEYMSISAELKNTKKTGFALTALKVAEKSALAHLLSIQAMSEKNQNHQEIAESPDLSIDMIKSFLKSAIVQYAMEKGRMPNDPAHPHASRRYTAITAAEAHLNHWTTIARQICQDHNVPTNDDYYDVIEKLEKIMGL